MASPATQVIGRDGLVAEVGDLLAAGRVATLVGEPGVGKTTVWSEVLTRAQASWSWSARCLEVEAELGHAVLADFYAALPDRIVDALPAPQRRAIDIVLFRDDGEIEGRLADRLLGVTTQSVLSALRQEGPIVIGIDDAQWCDPTSFAAFDYAFHRVVGTGLAVLTSRRAGPARDFIDAVVVDVPRLAADSIRLIVRDVTGRVTVDAKLAEIADLSGGNPFFARELARQLASEPGAAGLPRSLHDVLGRRIDGVDPAVRTVLLDVAVRGSASPDALDPVAVGDARRADLLVVEDSRLRFSHPLLGTAVLDAASPEEIRSAHGRAAASLRDPIAVAVHRARFIGPSDEVACGLDAAVIMARERGDCHGARGLAELALEMTPGGIRPAERVMNLANLEHALGHAARAGQLGAEALEVADSPSLRYAALRCIAGSITDHEVAVAVWKQAAEVPGLSSEEYGSIIGLTADELFNGGRMLEAITLIEATLATVADPVSEWPALIGFVAYLRLCAAIPNDRRLLDRAVEVERARNANPGRIVASLQWAIGSAAIIAVQHDRHDEAQALLEEAAVVAARNGQQNLSAYFPGLLSCRVGALRHGLAQLIDAGDADGPNPAAAARIAVAHTWLGNLDQIDDLIEQARTLMFWSSDRSRGEIDYATALKLVLGGSPAEAWPILEKTAAFLDSIDYREPSHPPVLPLAVEAACAAGDLASAEVLCTRLERDSATVISRFGLAAATRSRGLIAQSRLDNETALVHFASAAQAFTDLGVPLEAGRCQLALGALLRRVGRRSEARAVLMVARSLFATSEAIGLVTIVDAELGRIGGRVASAPADLTPSERQVADLVAKGLRNSEIAATLFLSVKTVETHLGRAYRKLGVRGRTELARVLNESG